MPPSRTGKKRLKKRTCILKVNKDLVKIYLKEIIYIESIKDYVNSYTG